MSSRNSLLSSLSTSDFDLLAPHLEAVTLGLRKMLERPNKRIEAVYFPETGFASVVAVQRNGKQVEVGLIGREGMTGLPIVLGNHRSPHATYIQAPGMGQCISAAELREAMQASVSLRDFLLKFVQAFGVQTTHTAVCNAQSKIDERLARWSLMAQDRIPGRRLAAHARISIAHARRAAIGGDGGVEGAAATRTDFVSARANRDQRPQGNGARRRRNLRHSRVRISATHRVGAACATGRFVRPFFVRGGAPSATRAEAHEGSRFSFSARSHPCAGWNVPRGHVTQLACLTFGVHSTALSPQSPVIHSIGCAIARIESAIIGMDKSSLRSAFSPRKWPGYALSLLGLGQTLYHWGWSLLDIGGRLDTLWRIAESVGGTPAMLTTAILWPWTGIILIISGVMYVVFVGEPTSGVQRHHSWPYVGWAIAAFVFVSMAGTALYGAMELHIRSEIAKGIAGVARGTTPSENNQAHPQRPLSLEDLRLQPDQIRILKEELPKLRGSLNQITIAYVQFDSETLSVANQYFSVFERSGIPPQLITAPPSGPEEEGVIIEVKDKTKIPPTVKRLLDIFAIADIHPTVHDGKNTNYVQDYDDFFYSLLRRMLTDLLITPSPPRLRRLR